MNTAAIASKPLSKRLWLEKLQPLLLPVDPLIKARALQKLRSPSGNAENVGQILLADPVQVLRIVYSANKLLAKSANEVKSVAHGISLLGVPATEQLLGSAAELEPNQGYDANEFRQQLLVSLHAACQLLDWSDYSNRWTGDNLFLTCLLRRAPVWALWHQAGDTMLALTKTRANGGGSHSEMETLYLGCSMQTLCASLCRQWHLPQATQLSWFPSESGDARQWAMLGRIIPEQAQPALEKIANLQQLVARNSFAIALANNLAESADRDWFCHRTLRLQHILSVALGQPLPRSIQLSHQGAVHTSHQYSMVNTFSPAAQLLGGFQRQQFIVAQDLPTAQAANEAQRDQGTPTPADHDPLQGAPAELLRLIGDLRRKAALFNDLHALFNRVIISMCNDMGFERACVSLLNAKTQELRTYYSYGCDDSSALKTFHHQLGKRDLFSKLLSKPLSLHLQPGNYAQIWPLLPGTFKRACGADQFVIMSLFVKQRPLALIYADMGHTNADISASQYDWFKQLCSATSVCLTQRTRQNM